MKHIKIITLAALSALALSGLAGVATASAATFQAESYPASIAGAGTKSQVFQFNAGTYSCSSNSFSGELSAGSEELLVEPTIGGCSYFGQQFSFADNGCLFDLRSNQTMDIVCGETPISFRPPGTSCVVTIGSQRGLAVRYANTGEGTSRKIAIEERISGLEYSQNSACSGGAGTYANGLVEGKWSMSATDELGFAEGLFLQ